MGELTVEPLDGPLGARVSGIDLTAPISEADAGRLRQALYDHQLLLVSGQELADDDHVAFARVFGELAAERNGVIGMVSNTRPDGVLGPDGASWHSDYTFFSAPYEAISLYGIEIPASGSQTYFANGVLAARTLPPDLRARVSGLQGRAVADIAGASSVSEGVRYKLGRCDGVDPHQLRPVLWRHRVTGEEILAVWEQQTDAILPLDPTESDALLEELFAHLYQSAHVYVHDWRPLDLVLWDNHALQHSRPVVGTTQPRTLRRVCVGETQDLSPFYARAAARGMA